MELLSFKWKNLLAAFLPLIYNDKNILFPLREGFAMKKLIALLLILVLLPVTAVAVTFNPYSFSQSTKPSLPSFATYLDQYATIGTVTTEDYLIYEKYYGKPSNIAPITESYVAMLVDTFKFEIIDEQWADFGSYARITYSLTLDTRKTLSTFQVSNPSDEPTWETPYANVIVQYTIPDSGMSYVHLYYSPEFNVVSPLKNYAPPGKTSSPAAKPTKTPKPTTDAESSATY